ncbi:hypothetical protein EC843_10183 [Buttiauxella sp. JUb87]|uniref:hypothetical protein n=1 Tax=Buttiauxella sp. JUb87 TaxID=2485129 RepID=UPI00105ED38E|nr:hypothetical protein [Buttiauxella sp. JUb87]TDN54042.1 hypothetical protein EC843_10183 [Buttiauxella sp. JUb87]
MHYVKSFLLFIITLSIDCHADSIVAKKISNGDCEKYSSYKRSIESLNGVDSFNKLTDYISENEVQCDDAQSDINEILKKIYAYFQGGVRVEASAVFFCDNIIDEKVCESEHSDGTEHGHLRSERNNFRYLNVAKNSIFIPAVVNKYSIYKVFYSWQNPLLIIDYVYPIETLRFKPIKENEYYKLSDHDFGNMINTVVSPSDINSGYSSNKWLIVLYKKNESDYIKAVWYYQPN